MYYLIMAADFSVVRLYERFSKLSSHGGPCPLPCFTQQEQFYTEFLLATDRYINGNYL